MAGGSSTETVVVVEENVTTEITATAEFANEDGTITVYETVTITDEGGNVTEETRVVGEEGEATDEEAAVEINLQIDDVEQMKETAEAATTLAEKLVKEDMEVE